MEDIKKIKTIISKINRKCDKEHISLYDVLKKLNISIPKFLEAIGFKFEFNENLNNSLLELFSAVDTRINFNPAMENLDSDEIEIYSSNLNMIFHFNNKMYAVNKNKKNILNEYIYYEEESAINANNILVSYKLETTIELKKTKTRIITRKYPLKHMKIKVTYNNGSYEFIINEDMLQNDLDYILKLLNSGNYAGAYVILNKYPCCIKIIDDDKKIE